MLLLSFCYTICMDSYTLYISFYLDFVSDVNAYDPQSTKQAQNVVQNFFPSIFSDILCRYTYRLRHRLFNGTYVWSQNYRFRSSPYLGQDSLQRIIIFGDMGKVGIFIFKIFNCMHILSKYFT